MKTNLLSLTLILALFAGFGCDSNDDDDDEMTDAELIAGGWGVTKIRNDANGTNVDITAGIFGPNGTVKDNGFTFTFNPNTANGGLYQLKVDYKDDAKQDLNIQGAPFTYTVTPSATAQGKGKLTIQVPLGGGTVPAQADYEITSNSTMTALIDQQVMNAIFATNIYTGKVAVEFTKRAS